MRIAFICTILVLLTVVHPLFSAEEALPLLPIYAGGKVDFELNIAEDDFLPAFRQFLALAPVLKIAGGFPTPAVDEEKKAPTQAIDPEMRAKMSKDFIKHLQAAIEGLRQFSVAVYRIPSDVRSDQIANFYMQKLGLTKGWRSILRVDLPQGMFRIYAMPNLEGIFGLITQNDRVIVGRTIGKIDLAAISVLWVKYFPAIAEHMQEVKPQPSTSEQVSPVPEQPNSSSVESEQAK
ncbi:MAG: hypothetical protein QME62_08720 [Armatimonadota bacterium]|nr:hypothetical protein [Armatimonadota bacterium]